MLEIRFHTSAKEAATATIDFMSNRPIVAIMFYVMTALCIMLCFVFAITVYNHAARSADVVAVIGAVGWILFYKKINRFFIERLLLLRKFAEFECLYKIDAKSILYKLHTQEASHIEWKKLKLVLKNKDGYIIPLTGLANAGKFLWLPLHSLQAAGIEQELLDLFTKFKLKLKTI